MFGSWLVVVVNLLELASAASDHLFFDKYAYARDVAEMDDDFKVYWNVPTFQCHKYGLNFSSVSEEWGLIQNYRDMFRGDALAILYDPGLFPALLPTTAGGHPEVRNGGVPQNGNLSLHLDRFREDVARLMPATTFRGLAIIDFEHWRPVWRQNWMSLTIYRNYSRYLERRLHPRWSKQDIDKQAAEKFEYAAKTFLLETLRLAQALRPRARWGYYGFPFCFNNKRTITGTMPCSHEVIPENNRLQWLFEESTALYPSTYLRSEDMTENSNYQYITSRVNEAIRMSKVSPKKNPVYVYIWSKYQDANRFVSKEDLYNSISLPRQLGADGVVVWGATRDVNSAVKCAAMLDYLQTHLGPTVKHLRHSPPQPNILQIFGK